eukprot:m51a1_g5 putative dna 3 phosphatase (656) ;mRNA; r:16590-19825
MRASSSGELFQKTCGPEGSDAGGIEQLGSHVAEAGAGGQQKEHVERSIPASDIETIPMAKALGGEGDLPVLGSRKGPAGKRGKGGDLLGAELVASHDGGGDGELATLGSHKVRQGRRHKSASVLDRGRSSAKGLPEGDALETLGSHKAKNGKRMPQTQERQQAAEADEMGTLGSHFVKHAKVKSAKDDAGAAADPEESMQELGSHEAVQRKRTVSAGSEAELFAAPEMQMLGSHYTRQPKGKMLRQLFSRATEGETGGTWAHATGAVPIPDAQEGGGKQDAAAMGGGVVWTRDGSLLVLNADSSPRSRTVCGFDMDDTLITTRSGRVFATGRSDWKWLFECIPDKLRALHAEGKKVVIFTNQGGVNGKNGYDETKERMICGKIEDMVAELGFPVLALVATTEDVYRKPATNMWDYMARRLNGGAAPDLSTSIFVGDAAGRPERTDVRGEKQKKDFSCSDRKFAYNVGVWFRTPEEYFLGDEAAAFGWDAVDLSHIPTDGEMCEGGIASLTSKSQELIVMVGFPASGKSTLAARYLVPHGYVRVNRDTLKTKEKCIKAAEEALDRGKSVVIDNTNPARDTRAVYVGMAKARGVPVRCFWMQADEKLAQHLNYFREAMFKKDFEAPTVAEGFREVKKINFVAKFDGADASKTFFQMH